MIPPSIKNVVALNRKPILAIMVASLTCVALSVSSVLADGSISITDSGVAAQMNWDPYLLDMKRRIKRAYFPVRGGESKTIVVTFNSLARH